MLRRLHPEQPDSFAFTPANLEWAQTQLSKYPVGRQASAVIPLLWRAQEQEGWLSKPALEYVADMLGMDYIRVLEVATFYFMFQLQPVGSVAHFQICGTTSCMIMGAEDLVDVCKRKIAKHAHDISADGKFSWEEVECLGACTNAPMAQVGKDYYEDLTPEGLDKLIDELAAGNVPTPGPQNGRFAAEPLGGATVLKDKTGEAHNGSVARAVAIGDTVKRIDGTEVPLSAPWFKEGMSQPQSGVTVAERPKPAHAHKAAAKPAPATEVATEGKAPALLEAPEGEADDLKKIKGVGPKLEGELNAKGVWHFHQIASWSAEEVSWADEHLVSFKGRVSRDDWVGQAKLLAEGGETAFSKKVDKGDVY